MTDIYLTGEDGQPLTDETGTPLFLYSVDPALPQAPTYPPEAFAAALQRLLPRGRAWPRDPDAVQSQVVAALASTLWRVHGRANGLLVDAFPASTEGLLPEWEATLGLPDPCAGPDASVTLRRQHVVARIGARGGQSVPYLVGYAAALGYAITVQEFAPFRAGMRCGQPAYGVDWAHAWRVVVAGVTVVPFRAGQNRAGDRLATWGSRVLECELGHVSPAHTILRFAYAGPSAVGIWDGGIWDRDTWAP